ncbi:hypothetical protein E2C01_084597 [Portunus trituberculatus]|uniref:Uncharacterized protein n=1 Tax=Portunus trituberculatus TaxID=210409 RepID=A0A5B7J599_PORTR|nr:hypothetical protein [Portunus trituberculatus]
MCSGVRRRLGRIYQSGDVTGTPRQILPANGLPKLN